MTNLTEREEQEMIERAKAGDPEANYKMSFWALEQAAAEPSEERWNRLAAKCLVKAAQAGYEPARKRMARLLKELDKRESAETEPKAVKEEALPAEPEPESVPDASDAGIADKGKELASRGKELLGKAAGLFSVSAAGHAAANWSEGKWKRMQVMCTIACVVLAFLIVLMCVTGKEKRKDPEEAPQMPTAVTAEPIAATPSPSPVPYPDEATRQAIEGAELAVYPEDGDYVSEATTATVNVTTGLNLRSGPAASYDQIVLMDDGAELSVYAEKNGWMLVLHNGDTYGWCSDDYLNMD